MKCPNCGAPAQSAPPCPTCGETDRNKLTPCSNSWHVAQSAPAHDSDCAVHNAPAYPPGECDCSQSAPAVEWPEEPSEAMLIEGMECLEFESDMRMLRDAYKAMRAAHIAESAKESGK